MTPWVTRLLIANLVMYFLTRIVPILPVFRLAFVPRYILFQPWTVFTYMFVHAPGFMHIGFNMLMLYFFGPRLEARLGSKRFMILYFASGIMGGLLSFVTPAVAIIGASAAVFGVMFGYAHFWPRERIYIWGVLPIPARGMLIGMTVLALWGGMGLWGRGIAHFAHLGGFAGAFIYLKWVDLTSDAAKFRAKARVTTGRRPGGDGADAARWAAIRREEMHPVNQEELDRLLDKIGTAGVGALTDDERAFLERFSSR